jgi:hypothetical protein
MTTDRVPTIAEYAAEIAANWPPLTEDQKAELARALAPIAIEVAARRALAARKSPRRAA